MRGSGALLLLLCSSLDAYRVSWHKNLGGGAFGPQQVIGAIGAPNTPYQVMAADLNGDGIPDVSDPKPRGDDGGVTGGGGQVGTGTAPAVLGGLAYGLTDSAGLPDYTLNFTSPTAGDETLGTDVTTFTYVFTPNGTTAALRLHDAGRV